MSSAKLRAVVWGRDSQPGWFDTLGGKPRKATDDEILAAEIPEQDHYQWATTVELYEGDLHRYSEHDQRVLAWAELECLAPADDGDDDE